MTWKKNDGQPGLRASIASKLAEAGLPAEQAEKQATSELLRLRKLPAGKHEVHAGNTVIIVESKNDN